MLLNLNSKIDNGQYKGKTVEFIIKNNKKFIFSLIKEGYEFDNEVLSMAGIKKYVSEPVIKNIIVDHDVDNKVYEKDTLTVSRILNEISTLDNNNYKQNDMFESENESNQTNKELIDEDDCYIN